MEILRPFASVSANLRPARLAFAVAFLGAFTADAGAGDILRGGATAAKKRPGEAQASSGAAAAERARAVAKDRLAKTSQAIQSVRAMQQAARSAANRPGMDPNRPGVPLPSVPNGLGAGGLDIIGTPTGAGSPTQSGTTVTIKQTTQQAILNWKTFNVGSKTKLVFDQSKGGSQSGQWIAFNKVSDPSGSPSQILGSIKAQGQVYVINQNGIIFGNGSQVNVHTLVASALPINDNLVTGGLLNNPDSQFLFSVLPIAAGSKGTAAFTPPAPLTPNGKTGNVTVMRGAEITVPTNSAKTGGRVMLVGPNVTNAGTISTPDGQTILAAGLQVGIDAHSSKDPSLRGLDVFVGAIADPSSTLAPYAGTAVNSGIIDAPRGNITVTGKSIKQLGILSSTTSVSLNGRIDLLANYDAVPNPRFDSANADNGLRFIFKKAGSITIGEGSLMQILPEVWSTEVAAGNQLAQRSQINLQGYTVHFAADSILLAPSANVSVKAGIWRYIDTPPQSKSVFIYSAGQIYVDNGAIIDVAGTTGVTVPLDQSILTLQLRGSELSDAPLQRDALLRAVLLTVDIRNTGTFNGKFWVGTPLGDATGYANLIERSVAQLTTSGGTVDFKAGGSVVLREGATIDVSGGWTQNEGGPVKTTRVLYQGNLIDIADATPDRLYSGIYTGETVEGHAKWGVYEKFVHALAMTGAYSERGQISGADGGTISITAPAMALDGTLTGQTVEGPRQVRSSLTSSMLPKPGTLNLAFQGQEDAGPNFITTYPDALEIIFREGVKQTQVADFTLSADGDPQDLDDERKKTVYLSTDLLSDSGFGALRVSNETGIISVPLGVTVRTKPGGALSLVASNVDVQGSIYSSGGSIKLQAINISPYLAKVNADSPAPVILSPVPGRGIVSLGASAVVSAAGLIVDDRQNSETAFSQPIVIHGGAVEIDAYTASLSKGSVIDVSGGVVFPAAGEKVYGNAGSIAIRAGQDTGSDSKDVLGGLLELGATLRGYSGAKGGSLTLQAQLMQIGGTSADPRAFVIQPEFFNKGGFGSFTIAGLGAAGDEPGEYVPAVVIAPGTVIAPYSQSLVAMPYSEGGRGIDMKVADKPVGIRTPVSLHFSAPGISIRDTYIRGDIVMGENSLIVTDPLGEVSLKGQTVAVLGSIYAPGGSIEISGASDSKRPFNDTTVARTTVYIGSKSVLSAAGTTLYSPDPYGRRVGTVLPGGLITVHGNIVAAAGAVLDVSGASAILDVHPSEINPLSSYAVPVSSGVTAPLYRLTSVPVRVDSNGGAIILEGGQMLYSDATLRGFAGGPSALGGALIVSSGRFYAEGVTPSPLDPNLVVKQSGNVIGSALPDSAAAIGMVVQSADGLPSGGQGYFSVEKFAQGGFDVLALKGKVDFRGNIDINARQGIMVADGGILYADSTVKLTAPYVSLGMPFPLPVASEDEKDPFLEGEKPLYFPPTFGPGRLIVNASLIDIGTLLLQNIGYASLSAPNGDIRGSGTFNIAGDLVLTAGQIYPVTASSFSITAYDRNIKLAAAVQGSTAVTLASAVLPAGFGVGSPLLGSVVKSIDGAVVTLESGANASLTNSWQSYAPGSVTIIGSGTRQLPLSAGGTLSIYASIINQGGVLRAPFGAINLGWDGTGTAPHNPLSNGTQPFPVAQQLNLRAGSVTSVSAIDPLTGEGAIIPYGLLLNGSSWIDPRGVDISAGGIAGKTISIAATNLSIDAGSLIDIRGGGDLYAYRWVRGNGGTNDILGTASLTYKPDTTYAAGTLVSYGGKTWSARVDLDASGFINGIPTPEIGPYWNYVPESFAVIPGYSSDFAPFAPFNVSSSNFNGDPGYVSSLGIGDRVYLGASNGLAAGSYTLLPARYALLPGAFLVTPKDGRPMGTVVMSDGSSVVSGYRYNDLNTTRAVPTLSTRFEVASSSVFRQRAEYEDYFANSFLSDSAKSLGVKIPRLPMDAGHLVLQATQSMALLGDVLAWGAPGGRGGWVDIASTSDILIGGKGATGGAGQLVLDASHLSKFGAESLLIGGVRTETADGVHVNVLTGNITVDNAGSPLTAPDVILVAKKDLILEDGAQVIASGSLGGPADTLYLGDSKNPGSGDGTLLRVSASTVAQIIRSGVSDSTVPRMVIGANALISGTSLTLDSTYATSLDPTADLVASVIALNSGQISIQLDNPGALQPTQGLVLGGEVLADVRNARALSLLSYSSLDIYGTGTFDMTGSLALHASTIRGFNNGGGTVVFDAKNITLDNSPGRSALVAVGPVEGSLQFNAETIRLGAGQLDVKQYSNLTLDASRGLFLSGTGGLSIAGNGTLTATTPFISAASQSTYAIKAGGNLAFQSPIGSDVAAVPSGLGASLTLEGSSVNVTSDIRLPSGLLTLHATTGDVFVGGLLDVGGTAQTFYDLIKYTSAGQVRLLADAGSVQVADTATISVAAHEGGGDAGTLGISTPQGTFTLDGTLLAKGGAGGKSGSFVLDTGSLPVLSELNTLLNNAAFNESRSIRVRTGDVLVDGTAKSRVFDLSADAGSITVSGIIDASGITGGTINLQARGNVTLLDGSLLTVAAENFSSAGKGGEVFLSSGTQSNGAVGTGWVDIQTGSTIDLSVASKIAGVATTPGTSAWQGQFSGKLHVRAPQNAAGTDLLVQAINGNIIDASSIVVEGYKIFDLAPTNGVITGVRDPNNPTVLPATGTVQRQIYDNGVAFLGANGTASAGYANMLSRLLGSDSQGLNSVFVIAPGAELINQTGNITLGSSSTNYQSDWNLSDFRFGVKGAAGVLTLRAKGDIVFNNALSDGFTPLTSPPAAGQGLWLARPTVYNPLLPANAQSWSYNLTAGADLSGAGLGQVLSLAQLGTTGGTLKLGKPSTTTSTTTGSTSSLIGGTSSSLYQVIRTGSGDININTGRSVQLLNQLATIYTAGTRVADATMGGTFDNPNLSNQDSGSVLGSVQQTYVATYTMAGGNVSIRAAQNIEHLAGTSTQLVADSQLQMPNNWLHRRGFVDPATGKFGLSPFGDVQSTTWWVNFSNFFQGVGALGGGNVTMIAGNDVSNVDAVIPTNARMPGKVAGSPVGNPETIAPDASSLLELGGGDLVVRAGNNIDAGVYYVERGHGILDAGGEIKTNSTRAVNRGSSAAADAIDSSTWLPTTLFVGKGGFDVSARRDVLLGPTANPFLLPGGLLNSFWYKTYFSTYAPDSYVNATSLGGDVTLRTGINDGSVGLAPSLYLWARQQQLFTSGGTNSAAVKPWLRLNENGVSQFITVSSLLPPSIKATSFSRNINLAGDLTLFPAPRGTIELLAAEGINGLQPTGSNLVNNGRVTYWASSVINVSDASPASIPGIANPYAYQAFLGYDPKKPPTGSTVAKSEGAFLEFVSELFRESGSTEGIYGSSETKQALHTAGLLHLNDPNPTRIYAKKGDISGFTFFSPKPAQVFAGRDISDIAFYLQNLEGDDVSIITSGRDIISYNANTPLRALANSAGNLPNNIGGPRAGDIQINGPGMLEVLAGRNLDLGTGGAFADGTGTGITSIGNGRNPYLGFEGADIIAVAGIGSSRGLAASALDFDRFASEYLDDANIGAYLTEIGVESGTSLEDLTPEQRSALALKIFFLVLRDTGRNFNDPDSAGYKNYDSGYAAIAALLGNGKWKGDINTRGRDIRTKSGGDITVMAPGGSLTLATSVIGRPPVPPGIVTEGGGSISIFTEGNVNIGISRIFTLRGGDLAIWSTNGDIAAGSSSKTVKSAPPTRVLIDPQSADVATDLAGLATGGGIGVLATVADVPPGNVDLIAPAGTIDAGDAGIRATGTVVLAADRVLNADNITAAQTVGAPPAAPPPAAPNISGLTAGSTAAGAASSSMESVTNRAADQDQNLDAAPSIITVEVLGYGGGDGEDEEQL